MTRSDRTPLDARSNDLHRAALDLMDAAEQLDQGQGEEARARARAALVLIRRVFGPELEAGELRH